MGRLGGILGWERFDRERGLEWNVERKINRDCLRPAGKEKVSSSFFSGLSDSQQAIAINGLRSLTRLSALCSIIEKQLRVNFFTRILTPSFRHFTVHVPSPACISLLSGKHHQGGEQMKKYLAMRTTVIDWAKSSNRSQALECGTLHGKGKSLILGV